MISNQTPSMMADYSQFTGQMSIKITDISDLTLQDPKTGKVTKIKALCFSGYDEKLSKSEFKKMINQHQFAYAILERGTFKKIVMHNIWIKKLNDSKSSEIAIRHNNGIQILTETVDADIISREKYEQLIKLNKSDMGKSCIIS